VLVKDIHPGDYPSDARELTPVGTGVNQTLFFTARDGVHGRELWKSDGTEAGTALVRDIHTGVGSSYDAPSFLTDVGGTLFFSANDGNVGQELWKSDGTEAGTVLVKDVQPGAGGSYYDGPAFLTTVGPTLFFTEDDVVHGRELWKSDGTEAGTVLVKDIHPGAGSPYDESTAPTAVGDTLYFAADDGVRGQELWRSDGTEAGTVLVQDVNRGGAFRVVSGKADTRKGTVTVRVLVAGGGTLVARPAAGSELRKSVRVVAESTATTITLRPTRAGMRILKRDGSLRVRARFTFTPCGGTGSSVVRPFTLKLR
jgi:ELWxxDGT repeat protein